MENTSTDTGAGSLSAPVFSAVTVNVIVRHNARCKDKDRGGDWRKCRCPKALLIYEGGGSGTVFDGLGIGFRFERPGGFELALNLSEICDVSWDRKLFSSPEQLSAGTRM